MDRSARRFLLTGRITYSGELIFFEIRYFPDIIGLLNSPLSLTRQENIVVHEFVNEVP